MNSNSIACLNISMNLGIMYMQELGIVYTNMWSKKYNFKSDFFQLNKYKVSWVFARSFSWHLHLRHMCLVLRYEIYIAALSCKYIRGEKCSETNKLNTDWFQFSEFLSENNNLKRKMHLKKMNRASIKVLYLYYIFRFWN